MKKIISILLATALIFVVAGCGTAKTATEETTGEMNVYVLSGPTGIGALNLMKKSEEKTTENSYNFTVAGANDEIVAAISDGQADVAAVATNLAATLYNKTDGGVTVLAVNTTGVLSMFCNPALSLATENIADLKGHTIYTPGQGANPEYILRYVLSGNGLDPDKDVTIKFVTEGSELMSVWATDPAAFIMAPQPVATTLVIKQHAVKIFDMTAEWDKISTDSALMMGCVIVRNDFLAAHEGVVKTFLSEYKASVEAAQSDTDGTAALCETNKMIPSAEIAKKAIGSCGLCFVTGNEMKKGLSGYLSAMYKENPKSVGGKLPANSFYYEAD